MKWAKRDDMEHSKRQTDGQILWLFELLKEPIKSFGYCMENELSTMNRRDISTQALNDNKNKVNCWISSEFSIPWLSGAIIGKTSVKWSYCNFIVFQIGTSSTLGIQLWEDQDKVFYWLQMLLKFNQRLLEDCLKSVRMSAHVGAKNLKLLADHVLTERYSVGDQQKILLM